MSPPQASRGEAERGTDDAAPPRRARSVARRTLARALVLARLSALPDDPRASRDVLYLSLAIRGARRLVRRLRQDRIQARAAALAFHTLLSVVPIAAVSFALLEWLGIMERRSLVEAAVERYFPTATAGMTDTLVRLLGEVHLQTAGLIGVAALLPVMIALVSQVELAMTDIFRTRRPRRLRRMFAYALLVIVAPVGAVVTVQYTPRLELVERIDRFVGPLLVTFVVLYLAFRFLPGSRTRNRAAFAGAALSATALAVAKLLFGVWATDFARGVHLVWGAVAFVPMALLWVFMAWFVVLLGAEVAAVLQELIQSPGVPAPARRRRRARWQRRRRWRRRAAAPGPAPR